MKGSKPVRLTTSPGLYTEPAWTFQGNKIVFLRGSNQIFKDAADPFFNGGQEDLLWVSGDGGAVNFIAKAKGRATPHFVKGDDRIYLFSFAKGLLSIRWDGTDEKVLVKVSGITTYGSAIGENHCMLVESATEPQNVPSNAGIIKIAPEGDRAFAQVNNDIYVVTIPKTGGEVPKISVADASSAQFPAIKLTKIGGEFPSWSTNGKIVYYTLGNAFFTYNIEESKAKELELKKKKAAEEKAKEDGKEEKKEEKKDEVKKDSTAVAAADKKKEEKKDEGYKPGELRIKVTVQKDIPNGKVLLQNARIITMKGNEIIERGDILN